MQYGIHLYLHGPFSRCPRGPFRSGKLWWPSDTRKVQSFVWYEILVRGGISFKSRLTSGLLMWWRHRRWTSSWLVSQNFRLHAVSACLSNGAPVPPRFFHPTSLGWTCRAAGQGVPLGHSYCWRQGGLCRDSTSTGQRHQGCRAQRWQWRQGCNRWCPGYRS